MPVGPTCSEALPVCTGVRVGLEDMDDLLEHAWQKLFENLTRDLYSLGLGFLFLINRRVLLLSESSLFSSELLMYFCCLGLHQPWLSKVLCSLYS